MKPTVIAVTGLPGTGKTTLSKKVAAELRLPLISKDAIKERLFDVIGWQDQELVSKIAQASFSLLEYFVAEQLRAAQSVILELNMQPKWDTPRLQRWCQEYDCQVAQVVCQTELQVLARRFTERIGTTRHPGHPEVADEEANLKNLQQRIMNGESEPLAISGPVYIIDTTDFGTVDEGRLTEQLRDIVYKNR